MVSPKKLDFEADTMSLEEFAARLGISLTTAYEKAQRDVLPVPRIPGIGRYRFSRRAYDELMARQHPCINCKAA